MLRFIKPSLAGIWAFMALTGCASTVDLASTSRGSHLRPEVLQTAPYPIQALLPTGKDYKTLRVYIEGDGHAWATRTQPSTDPTPRKSIMAVFAAEDSEPAVYLARPCQFVMADGCKPALWTSDRFGRAAVDAMNSALNSLKARYQTQTFELVGYSGGAAIALILAGERNDVRQVRTIAGNLDPNTWARLKHLTPLSGSLSPLAYSARLAIIPQQHLIGDDDQVIPAGVLQAYLKKLKPLCTSTVVVPGATHDNGYASAWRAARDQPFKCETTN
ncbi:MULTISPECIES: alpha/beta hydrolase [Pseudomonas]|uniref:alpha/beta hydrolase n=1 Tax=Pseudomonas TaxID=286 RepID=UPI0002E21812|nr:MULTISPECIES: alpha/beta hydrolase [Pseudomonas]MDU4255836.1 alpha/beta hydrolase [Pseudomonas sp.]HBO6301741.1 alpha/beta hydrolase [Pseudomonas aeruginosa]